MKVLAISYSYTGRCRRLRQALAARLGWQESEITDEASGRAPWRCILESLLRRKPRIRYTGPEPGAFDAAVLIAPVWAQRLAAQMRSFIHERGPRLPKVALVSVMGGNGAPEALAEVTRLLGHPPAVFAAFTQREIDDGTFVERLAAFGRSIEQARDQPTVAYASIHAPKAV